MSGRGLFVLLYKVDASRQISQSVFYSHSDNTQANMAPKGIMTKQTASATSGVAASTATATKRSRDNSSGTNHAASDCKRRKGDDGLQMNQSERNNGDHNDEASPSADDLPDNLPILDVIELDQTGDQCLDFLLSYNSQCKRKCPVHHDTFLFDYCTDESIQEHEADSLLSQGYAPCSKCFQVQSEIAELMMAPENQAEPASAISNEDQPSTSSSSSSSTIKRVRDDTDEDEMEYDIAPVIKKRKTSDDQDSNYIPDEDESDDEMTSSSYEEAEDEDDETDKSPSTSKDKKSRQPHRRRSQNEYCITCQVFKATLTIFNDPLLPQSSAQLCKECADLWPTTGLKIDCIIPTDEAVNRFTMRYHAPVLEEAVNTYIAADKKKKRSQLEDSDWDAIHQMVQLEASRKSSLAQFSATELRRQWHHRIAWIGNRQESGRDTSANWNRKENVALTKIVSKERTGDNNQMPIDWNKVARDVRLEAYKNRFQVRTGFDCFSRYQQRFNKAHRQNEEGRKGQYFWPKEETQKLMSFVKEHLQETGRRTPDWKEVRAQFPGTTETQLKTKYRRMNIDQKPTAVRPITVRPPPAVPKLETRGRKKKVVAA